MDHLERFKDLISVIKVVGVFDNYLLCKLFKYSLAEEASHWLKQLPPGSRTSWSDIKNAFLSNFFDEARAKDLRKKIAQYFLQRFQCSIRCLLMLPAMGTSTRGIQRRM